MILAPCAALRAASSESVPCYLILSYYHEKDKATPRYIPAPNVYKPQFPILCYTDTKKRFNSMKNKKQMKGLIK